MSSAVCRRRIIAKLFSTVLINMGANCFEKISSIVGQFLFADTADTKKFSWSGWVSPRHLPQRDIGKYHVCRNALSVGKLFPKIAQRLEQRLVAFDARSA